jgi:hypothetical protein
MKKTLQAMFKFLLEIKIYVFTNLVESAILNLCYKSKKT